MYRLWFVGTNNISKSFILISKCAKHLIYEMTCIQLPSSIEMEFLNMEAFWLIDFEQKKPPIYYSSMDIGLCQLHVSFLVWYFKGIRNHSFSKSLWSNLITSGCIWSSLNIKRMTTYFLFYTVFTNCPIKYWIIYVFRLFRFRIIMQIPLASHHTSFASLMKLMYWTIC